jgi:hypothetical protein
MLLHGAHQYISTPAATNQSSNNRAHPSYSQTKKQVTTVTTRTHKTTQYQRNHPNSQPDSNHKHTSTAEDTTNTTSTVLANGHFFFVHRVCGLDIVTISVLSHV